MVFAISAGSSVTFAGLVRNIGSAGHWLPTPKIDEDSGEPLNIIIMNLYLSRDKYYDIGWSQKDGGDKQLDWARIEQLEAGAYTDYISKTVNW